MIEVIITLFVKHTYNNVFSFIGCMSSPCKTGSLCSENGGGGAYTCACTNGMSGTNCDEFRGNSSMGAASR